MKNLIPILSDEILGELYSSMGVPKNLSDILIDISNIDKIQKKKKDILFQFDDDYYQDYYNVFVYDTCKYPPNSNPHKTLN